MTEDSEPAVRRKQDGQKRQRPRGARALGDEVLRAFIFRPPEPVRFAALNAPDEV